MGSLNYNVAFMSDPTKITQSHLNRRACLYIRQSSLHQVQQNKESQRRQYDLRERAIALRWALSQIDVIDEDQGKSGATSANRIGFQDLRARVGAGEVGILLCLEVSRLCRNNAEWQQLLQIASISNTLILDEYGVYDATDMNDWLLLGIKGQLSEFELRGIRARMVGGQRSKAQRGELKLALPVGLVYTETNQVVKHPDRSVRDAIDLVFRTFRRLKSAQQVKKWFINQGLLLPARNIGAPLHWNTASQSRIIQVLRNPRYAGCYVYGRRKNDPQPDGTCRVVELPIDQWMVCVQEAHEGDIDWEEYLQNREMMRKNATSFLKGAERVPSPRRGNALLQSRALCGICGYRMQVSYSSTKTKGQAWYYGCSENSSGKGKPTCQRIRGHVVDAAVSEFIVAAVNRENLTLSLMIREQLRINFEESDRQRQNRIVESRGRRGALRVLWQFHRFRSGPQSGSHQSFPAPCSSNRTCGFPASGFQLNSCLRPRKVLCRWCKMV